MHILDSIRNSLVPIHRAGYPFIAGFFLISVLLGFLWEPLFWLGLVLTAWCAYFFRDPIRIVPTDEHLVLSPADGRVSFVGSVVPPSELGFGAAPRVRVSVFMSVFDCHVNRAPVSGQIRTIAYREGSFENAELDKASEVNERNALVLETGRGDVGVVQIAGFVARRIRCFAKRGDDLRSGERFGLIRFGSRLDVYLPAGAAPRVAEGQTAIAGETVIAAFEDGPDTLPARHD